MWDLGQTWPPLFPVSALTWGLLVNENTRSSLEKLLLRVSRLSDWHNPPCFPATFIAPGPLESHRFRKHLELHPWRFFTEAETLLHWLSTVEWAAVYFPRGDSHTRWPDRKSGKLPHAEQTLQAEGLQNQSTNASLLLIQVSPLLSSWLG